MAMNKALFEENWKEIRSESAKRWSLMGEHDLVKVDKADVKFDKFVTMLQVKYGLFVAGRCRGNARGSQRS